jgi:hypothetical protein
VHVRQLPPPSTAAASGLAALLIAALAGSAAAKPAPLPKPRTITAAGRIETLALDGTRLAYDVAANGTKQRCNAVYVWNVNRHTTTRVSGQQTCGADNTSTGAGVRELALAGSRVAWIVNQGGNSESGDYLYTTLVAHPGERVLASAFRTGDVSGVLTGNWLGGLVGAGTFLVVNHWATDSHGELTTASLERVAERVSDIAQGTATMTARSTDGRQLAVLRSDGTVGIYSTRAQLRRTVVPSSAQEVALRGDYLVVLTKASVLEVYNSHSGRRLHTWRAAGAVHLDISSGLAAYRAGRTVHVVRLTTGKRVFGARAAAAVTAVQLEPSGLAYAFRGPGDTGRIVFVPMSRLR